MKGKRSKTTWIVSGVILLLAVVLTITGAAGFWMRGGDFVNASLRDMRNYAVLRTAAGAIIDELAVAAKREAREYADANKYSRNQRAAYAAQKEDEARAAAAAQFTNFSGLSDPVLDSAVLALAAAQQAYAEQEAAEKAAYAEAFVKAQPTEAALAGLESVTGTDETGGEAVIDEEDLAEATQPEVDYTNFQPSEQLTALKASIDPLYTVLSAELTRYLPELTPKMVEDLQTPVLAVTYAYGQDFEKQYDRYETLNALGIFARAEQLRMSLARRGDDLITLGIGLMLLALGVFFYRQLVAKLGMPRLVILAFFVLLCVVAGLYGISVSAMIGNVLKRTGMFGVLALAMLPGIQSGINLNMGMTAGIIGGLLSTLIALENNLTGWGAFAFSVVVGCLFAIPIGWLYSKLLNRLKGNEMTVSTYVGFAFVSLMSIAWMLLPFRNSKITWALGTGLRVMHNMGGSFGSILNNFLSFTVFGVTVPTGLLLFFFLCCALMWLFSRSKTGTAMIAAGSNPRFAEAAGINVDRMRTIGTMISTVIAAVGIIVYSQSFGFMQLYGGPRQMGFIAASAILIGGATVTRAKVTNVILGTFLFQGVLALGIQVANAVLGGGGLSEVMRILISNGIILYALTQSGGDSRG
jgi:simple sugar transport system permease protein